MSQLNQFTVSLWGDEAFSAVLSGKPISQILAIITKDTSPPLYNLTLHFWYQTFGTSEAAIRLLSFIYFLLAVFFVYKTGLLLWNKKTGAYAALLTFFNPFFFTYAFEGRMYSILALGVASSMYFFLKIIYEKSSGFYSYFAYVLATTWALYSHHFSIFSIVVQGLWFCYLLLSKKHQKSRRLFASFIAIGVFYLPWVHPLFKQIEMVRGGFWLGRPTLIDLRNLIYEYLAEGIRNPILNLPFSSQPLSEISLYFVFLILMIRTWTKNINKTLFLLSWFLLPILITWALSQKFQSIFFNRYLLYTIPAIMLVLASNTKKISEIILVSLLIFFAVIDYHYFTHPTKQPFRDLALYAKNALKDGDLLVNWNSASHHLWESKYYEISAPIYLPHGDLPYYTGTAQMTSNDLLRQIPDHIKRVGVITSGNLAEITLPNYTEEERRIFGELKFVWYQKQPQKDF